MNDKRRKHMIRIVCLALAIVFAASIVTSLAIQIAYYAG